MKWFKDCLPSHEDGDDDAEVADDGEQDDGREDRQLLVVRLVEGRAAAAGRQPLTPRVSGFVVASLRFK